MRFPFFSRLVKKNPAQIVPAPKKTFRPKFVTINARKGISKVASAQVGNGKSIKVFRKAFAFNTHEANVFVTNFRGKRRMVRLISSRPFRSPRALTVEEMKKRATEDFYNSLLFYSLFPKNAIKPIALVQVQFEGEAGVRFGMVSDIVRNRSQEYKDSQRDFYEGGLRNLSKREQRLGEQLERHGDFCKKEAWPIADRIMGEAGVVLNQAVVNIINSKQTPIFLEVISINQEKLRGYIGSLPESSHKKGILRVFEHYLELFGSPKLPTIRLRR